MHAHTLIYAVRHGETEWNVGGRIQGQLDIGLHDKGRWQAQRTAEALAHERIDAVYSSDLARAYDTAHAIAQPHRRTVRTHTGLRERAFSEIEAKDPVQARRWRKREPEFAPPGGESLIELRERVLASTEQLASSHVNHAIVVVAHGGVMDILHRAATQVGLQAARTWALDNCAINRLMWSPEHGLHLIGWNDVFHLDADPSDDVVA
jgi:2,3-bisphosphoglycerate-dependent phosphoglycerate mutase